MIYMYYYLGHLMLGLLNINLYYNTGQAHFDLKFQCYIEINVRTGLVPVYMYYNYAKKIN